MNNKIPTPYYPEVRGNPRINPRNKEGGYTYQNGLIFEEWAEQINTPNNRLINKFGMHMSVADSPKIHPNPSCFSPHGIVSSNHGSIPTSLNGRVSF